LNARGKTLLLRRLKIWATVNKDKGIILNGIHEQKFQVEITLTSACSEAVIIKYSMYLIITKAKQ
jgi:hypothetical protein